MFMFLVFQFCDDAFHLSFLCHVYHHVCRPSFLCRVYRDVCRPCRLFCDAFYDHLFCFYAFYHLCVYVFQHICHVSQHHSLYDVFHFVILLSSIVERVGFWKVLVIWK
eukprot:NODE_75_length_23955_cov_0.435069.p25 type:complete len:108 gc:universal NODE_75_length_23955_cov_0.435069:1294-1617(+)